jgi:hypothetical protein
MLWYCKHEKFKTFLLQLLVLISWFLWQLQRKDINSFREKYDHIISAMFIYFSLAFPITAQMMLGILLVDQLSFFSFAKCSKFQYNIACNVLFISLFNVFEQRDFLYIKRNSQFKHYSWGMRIFLGLTTSLSRRNLSLEENDWENILFVIDVSKWLWKERGNDHQKRRMPHSN